MKKYFDNLLIFFVTQAGEDQGRGKEKTRREGETRKSQTAGVGAQNEGPDEPVCRMERYTRGTSGTSTGMFNCCVPLYILEFKHDFYNLEFRII